MLRRPPSRPHLFLPEGKDGPVLVTPPPNPDAERLAKLARRRIVQNEHRRRKREKGMLVEFEISRHVIKKMIDTGWLLDHERDDKAQVSETLRALVEDMRPPENT
jgi:hypothetical protein